MPQIHDASATHEAKWLEAERELLVRGWMVLETWRFDPVWAEGDGWCREF